MHIDTSAIMQFSSKIVIDFSLKNLQTFENLTIWVGPSSWAHVN